MSMSFRFWPGTHHSVSSLTVVDVMIQTMADYCVHVRFRNGREKTVDA